VQLTNNGFRLSVTGTIRCTLPSTISISGFIWQDARDPNFGYPFATFVNCVPPSKQLWGATFDVASADLPFLPGGANVRIDARASQSGRQELLTEAVVLVER
jgi:hypothetical protein